MSEPVRVDTAGLRAVAAGLRDRVAPEVKAAAGHAGAGGDPAAVHGPTAGPAVRAFRAAWGAELETVRAAAEQLAVALEIAAGNYEGTDQETRRELARAGSHGPI
jgi:ABC-type branched-subunit amino acid transport system substrate-binding protein